MKLQNKVALISGGARMGEAIGAALAQKGCRVVFGYRRSAKAAQAALAQIRSFGGYADLVHLDLGKKGAAAKSLTELRRRHGGLDILVNMASLYEEAALNKTTEAVWQENFEANLSGGFRLIQAAVSDLRKRKGRIINFADWVSASGRPRYRNFVAYYTAKKAVIGLTESLALELAPDVLVNTVAPGPILPPKGMSAREYAAVVSATPLGRWGGAEEIAKAVLFLCETDFVTGECIRVDGGRHLN